MNIYDILEQENLAEKLSEEELMSIGQELLNGYNSDLASREGWQEKVEDYIRLATQVSEEKNFPWPGAANVKYPMLTTAAIQFSSRAYPALIQGNNPVKVSTIGYDPMGIKANTVDKISKHMSFQLLHQMKEWEEDMDRMLLSLPIIGTTFKKSYFSPKKGRNVSEYISPLDFVINYYAKSVEEANRKFHRLSFYENEIIEHIRRGTYRDVEVESESQTVRTDKLDTETQAITPVGDGEDNPYDLLEAHVFLDLDDDGYKEPYIVTMFENSGTIVRIVPRFTIEAIEFNDKEEVVAIEAEEYFTGYIFIPDPASTVYGLGFGNLLGPLNETVNTLINQLIDSGTLSNMGGGFLGRGFKLKQSGDVRFKPGEWKYTTSTGDDLRKNIFPLPIREPSNVLFMLLGTIIDSGQKLSSTMDIMIGESPGQNQPATTTMAVLEQGLKVFTSIHKRVYRSLKKELEKLFKLNAEYLDINEYYRILDAEPSEPQMGAISVNDYKVALEEFDITPAGDPNAVTQAQKLIKAEALVPLMQAGQVNPQEVVKRLLEAQEQPNIPALLQLPEPQPDPELVLKQMETEHKINLENRKLELDTQRIKSEAIKDESQAIYQRIKAEATMREQDMKELESEVAAVRESVQVIKEVDTPVKQEQSNAQEQS